MKSTKSNTSCPTARSRGTGHGPAGVSTATASKKIARKTGKSTATRRGPRGA